MAHVPRRIGVDAAACERRGIARTPGVHRQLREHFVGGGRIACDGELRMLARTRRLALEREHARQRQVCFGFERIEREHLPERVDRFLGSANPHQALRERFPRIEHARVARDDPLELDDRLFMLSGRGGRLRALQCLVRGDRVLRIWKGARRRRRRRRRGPDVAECLQSLADVGGDIRRFRHRRSRRRAFEPRAERARGRALRVGDVRALVRIGDQVEQLCTRRPDESVASIGGRRQIAPAEMQQRVQRFGIDRAVLDAAGRQRRGDRLPVEAGAREARQIEQRRRHVHLAYGARHARATKRAARQPQDPGHAQRFTIEKDAVLGLSVIVQTFSVIRHDGDDRAREEAARVQPIEKSAYQFVRVRKLAVVRIGHAMRGWRRVRRVRLVQMEEGKHAAARACFEALDPSGERVDRETAVALRVGERFARSGHLNSIVEEIEPAIDAGLMAKDVRGDRAAGGIARDLEPAGQRLLIVLQRVTNVVAEPMMKRQEACEQRRV